MRNLLFVASMLLTASIIQAQQAYYDVTPGDNYGLRFWSSDNFKISGGHSADYHIGAITNFSIKTTMDTTPGRGWTWGILGQTPVAGISSIGDFHIVGRASIGTANFTGNNQLEVAGGDYNQVNIRHTSNPGWGMLLTNSDNTYNESYHYSTSGNNTSVAMVNVNPDALHLGTGNQVRLTIDHEGKVGIGTTDPCADCLLDVDGKIRSEEVKVEVVNAPDYVFEASYDLPKLKETKQYIEQHKHLPEIPAGKDMEANGVDLGVMNMKLLKKIEEMTLHQIELMERLEEVESKIQKVNTVNATLSNQVNALIKADR